MSLKERYQQNISAIEKKFDGLPQSVTLVAVSKYVSAAEIAAAYQAGQRHFGENRPDTLIEKAHNLKDSCPEIKWHFIGNIQSNKIKTILEAPNLFAIHSIDQKKHLQKIVDMAGSPLKIFIQVNTSSEKQKGGVTSIEELTNLFNVIGSHSLVQFEGLMTMGKLDTDNFEIETTQCFEKLVEYGQQLNQKLGVESKYSMGMSRDYELALNIGTHYIRVGSAIFS